MCLCNTHIVAPLRESLHHHTQRTARRHSWCNPHDSLVLGSELRDRLPEDLLELRWVHSSLALDTLSRLHIKASRSVPYGRIFLSRLVAFALDRPEV